MSVSKFNAEGYHDPTVFEALTNIEKEGKQRTKKKIVFQFGSCFTVRLLGQQVLLISSFSLLIRMSRWADAGFSKTNLRDLS